MLPHVGLRKGVEHAIVNVLKVTKCLYFGVFPIQLQHKYGLSK